MITRIVKMEFAPGKLSAFLQIFEASKEGIRNYPGCRFLELWGETSSPDMIFTHSKWDNEEALLHYRQSELFKETWTKTKALFSKRAEAWTVEVIERME